MKATQQLQDRGQSLWLDNITRELLKERTLGCYINECSVTGAGLLHQRVFRDRSASTSVPRSPLRLSIAWTIDMHQGPRGLRTDRIRE